MRAAQQVGHLTLEGRRVHVPVAVQQTEPVDAGTSDAVDEHDGLEGPALPTDRRSLCRRPVADLTRPRLRHDDQ